MAEALTLFGTGIHCSHCGEDPQRDPKNGNLWAGFRDMDTGQLVCPKCRNKHYHLKWQTEKRGLYSEFPVPVPQ